MDKWYERASKALIVTLVAAATLFSVFSLGLLEPVKNGIAMGEIAELCDGWSYQIDGVGEQFATSLPASLPLPEDTTRIVLTNTMPETVQNGDVLRFQTLLGWYRIYIGGKLRLQYGNEEITERYLLENGSNMLLVPLNDADAGQELRVETGYRYANYLAQQHAPTLSTHRDLLMSDIIGGSSGMVIIIFLLMFAIILLVLWLLFLLKRQPKHFLLSSALFLIMGAVYYNVGNMFQCEMWGYPQNLPMYNDFTYYLFEFILPVAAYQLILGVTKKPLPRLLRIFVVLHTVFACAAVTMQMLWIANVELLEYISAILTLIGYIWLWVILRPFTMSKTEKKLILPVFLCVLCFLLDFYKLVGVWWPFPESWVTFLQVELPFMFFFPLALLLYAVMTLLGLVEMLVQERIAFKSRTDMALLQAQLAEQEYHSTMQSISQIRQIRHDMTHHLTAISALAAQGSRDELLAYINTLSDVVPEQSLSDRNFVTESFLEYYRNLCRDEGIAFEAAIRYDEAELTNKSHLGILLGNALKNSFEAASSSDSPRFIHVEGRKQGAQLVLIVQNSYSGSLNEDYRSTKGKERGLGLSGIRSVTESHNGYLELSHTDTEFTLKAVLVME